MSLFSVTGLNGMVLCLGLDGHIDFGSSYSHCDHSTDCDSDQESHQWEESECLDIGLGVIHSATLERHRFQKQIESSSVLDIDLVRVFNFNSSAQNFHFYRFINTSVTIPDPSLCGRVVLLI